MSYLVFAKVTKIPQKFQTDDKNMEFATGIFMVKVMINCS